ncbi:MAG: class I SAM-dependent methyltransferase [Acidobacteriota bacterium]|nr:class I SAM-dependent methyltransferase [Acidobacteriota bacterium]
MRQVRSSDCVLPGVRLVLADPRRPWSELMTRYDRSDFVAECLASLKISGETLDINHVRNHFHIPLALLGDAPRHGARLLDVGCGPGCFILSAAGRGWAGEGVEVSTALAAFSRNVAGVPVWEGTFESAGIPAEAYDAVTLLDVIEHVCEPQKVLAKAARVLKPGGKLIVSTPDFRSLSRLILGWNWAVLSPAEHLFYFTAGTLTRILKESGFEVMGPVNVLTFNPEATHAPGTRRHLRWRRIHTRLEKTRLVRKIQNHEMRRLLGMTGGSDAVLPTQAWKRCLLGLYDGLRTVVRGDMLYALAFKKAKSDCG